MSRTRNQTTYDNTGSGTLISKTGSTITSGPSQFIQRSSTCTDDVSPGYPDLLRENPLVIEKLRLKLPRITCRTYSLGTWRDGIAQRKVPSPNGIGSAWPTTSFVAPDLMYWETQAVARSNPNNPVVDLPLFLFEMKDFPRMLQDIGKLKTGSLSKKDVPDSWLSYNFGWAPLVSDLMSLLNLQDSIDQRIRSLARKNHKRVYLPLHESSSRVNLGKTRARAEPSIAWCKVEHVRTTRTRIWAVFDYTIDSLPDASDMRPFLGLGEASLATLWNALPWSWLIDYFSNVGTFLSTYRGSIPYKLENANIMAHTVNRIDRTLSDFDANYGEFVYLQHSNGYDVKERKARRTVSTARPHLRYSEFLTGFQKSILGALALSKVLR